MITRWVKCLAITVTYTLKDLTSLFVLFYILLQYYLLSNYPVEVEHEEFSGLPCVLFVCVVYLMFQKRKHFFQKLLAAILFSYKVLLTSSLLKSPYFLQKGKEKW